MNTRLTKAERETGMMEADKLERAVLLLNTRGYVVLEEVFEPDFLEGLRKAVHARDGDEGEKELPVQAPFTDSALVENPLVLSVVDAVVGDDCIIRVLRATRKEPGAGADPGVRIDAKPLFPDTEHMRFPTHRLVLTVPFTDLDEPNGAPELWPGTHAQPEHLTVRYGMETLRGLAEDMPSVRVKVPRGAVLIRDARVWSRDCPNRSSEPVEAVTLEYKRWWDITGTRLQVSEDVYENASPRLRKLLRFEAVPHRKA